MAPVDSHREPESLVLLVAAHVAQLGPLAERFDQFGRPRVQLLCVRVFDGVLELGAAHPGVDGEVLHGLHVERDPLDLRQLRLEAADHLGGADLPLA